MSCPEQDMAELLPPLWNLWKAIHLVEQHFSRQSPLCVVSRRYRCGVGLACTVVTGLRRCRHIHLIESMSCKHCHIEGVSTEALRATGTLQSRQCVEKNYCRSLSFEGEAIWKLHAISKYSKDKH